jgi:ergothioneine biosynthesis protein EgtB
MDIKHVLSCNPLDPAYRDRVRRPSGRPAGAGWLTSEGGLVEIGHDQRGFAFDNELPRHTVHLRPYAIAAAPVTNADWLAFIEDGGYARPELWLSDGWTAINSLRSDAPLYWCEQDGGWSCFTLAGRLPLDPAEPVCHVSYYEADAFARWAGCRLPTEVEWEHALGSRVGTRPRFDLDDLHPRPVTSDHAGVGEVWEWTASAYLPYPGFRPAAGAIGEYNGKFMVGQHVLRGSSCVTPSGHARSTYRNFFPPSARWPFTGCASLRTPTDAHPAAHRRGPPPAR